LVGLFCLLCGTLAYPPNLVHFQLDAVLSAEDYHNDAKRRSTEEMLLRAGGRMWVFWIAVGAVNISLGMIGVWTATERDERSID